MIPKLLDNNNGDPRNAPRRGSGGYGSSTVGGYRRPSGGGEGDPLEDRLTSLSNVGDHIRRTGSYESNLARLAVDGGGRHGACACVYVCVCVRARVWCACMRLCVCARACVYLYVCGVGGLVGARKVCGCACVCAFVRTRRTNLPPPTEV